MRQLNSLRSSASKVGLFVFAAAYLLFSIGVFKSTHYCMGRASSVTYFSSESKKCVCEAYGGEKHGCCDDEKELIQINDDHQPVITYHLGIPHIYVLGDLYTEQLVAEAPVEARIQNLSSTEPPPPLPIFKRNCSFIFYESEA
jgi:hypothetical protein